MTEQQLIKGLRDKSEEAFEVLFDSYKNILFFHINGILKNHQLSEEVLIDTIEKIYLNIDKFDGKFFNAWIIKIAKNAAISELRKTKDTTLFDDNILYSESISSYDYQDILSDLKEILSEEDFMIIIYHIVYNISLKEISEILSIPIGSISYRYRSSMKIAKNYFKEGKDESKKEN